MEDMTCLKSHNYIPDDQALTKVSSLRIEALDNYFDGSNGQIVDNHNQWAFSC